MPRAPDVVVCLGCDGVLVFRVKREFLYSEKKKKRNPYSAPKNMLAYMVLKLLFETDVLILSMFSLQPTSTMPIF